MSIKLPTATPDPTIARIMGAEYAVEAANIDRRIAARNMFERAETSLRKARKELETIERSSDAFQNRVTYYQNVSRLSMRIARAAGIIAEIHAEYPNDAKGW